MARRSATWRSRPTPLGTSYTAAARRARRQSQGQIGYLLAQALTAQLALDGRPRPVAPLLTRTVVDPEDPAFATPSKPVGPMYEETVARSLVSEHGWTIARDGTGWRRVVPSPSPLEIVEATTCVLSSPQA